MRRRLVLASTLALVCAKAFGAPVTSDMARSRADLMTLIPQGAVTLTPTATLTAIPSPSASPTFTFTPQPGTGDGGGSARIPTLSAGMLSLLALGLATVAILLIRRL
ncbi:MAG TPA: hypothetical protein VF902_07165 [Coriobacteriia bacterium]